MLTTGPDLKLPADVEKPQLSGRLVLRAGLISLAVVLGAAARGVCDTPSKNTPPRGLTPPPQVIFEKTPFEPRQYEREEPKNEPRTVTQSKQPTQVLQDTVTIYTDGTRQTRLVSGTVITEQPNSKLVTEHPGGTKTVEDRDGSVTIEYPDGMVEVHSLDGRFSTKHTDGTTVVRFPDGRRMTVYPSGKSVTRYRDGKVVTVHSDGSRVTMFADGRVLAERPDGSKHEALLARPESVKSVPPTATTGSKANGTH